PECICCDGYLPVLIGASARVACCAGWGLLLIRATKTLYRIPRNRTPTGQQNQYSNNPKLSYIIILINHKKKNKTLAKNN
ncbi:hypothetical protein, partial [Enterobacter intestinihominis]